jgi:NifU-like protein involved in Fe-S cluster formation
VDKTLLQFKIDFSAAYQEFRLTNQTAHHYGVHSANMMIEQVHGDKIHNNMDMIAKLAVAMASDRGTVATLTTTNNKLASQLEGAQSYIKMLKDEILALKAKIKTLWKGQRTAKST